MTIRDYDEIGQIPMEPGVYAFHAGGGRVQSVAYVGSSGKLRNRVSKHLEYRDSSVITTAAAAALNPEHIHSCSWWTHPQFGEKFHREAAELIAFDVLNPTLRSQGRPMRESVNLSQDPAFKEEMRKLFDDPPSGVVTFPSVTTAMRKIKELEARVEKLEKLTRDP